MVLSENYARNVSLKIATSKLFMKYAELNINTVRQLWTPTGE